MRFILSTRLNRVFALLPLLLMIGCATSRVDWSARVGSYTFDDAVVELGPPDKQAKLQDGTLVAEWLTGRGGTYASAYRGWGYYPYWYAMPPEPAYIDTPDYFLRLIFNPEGKLQSWKRFAK
jgi:hypothetical protein